MVEDSGQTGLLGVPGRYIASYQSDSEAQISRDGKQIAYACGRSGYPEVRVDANDGYSPELTRRLLRELPDFQPAFVEEMFPENVDHYRELKAFLNQQHLKTLIADGEGQSKLEGLMPYMEARVVDVYQADMNRFGIEGIMQEAASVGTRGFIGPHNWGSLVGFYMILHIGRAIANFYRAENDPLDSDVLIADGYVIRDGSATVPDEPGFGLKINGERFASTIKPRFDLRL